MAEMNPVMENNDEPTIADLQGELAAANERLAAVLSIRRSKLPARSL
jgi:hypothetical protein